MKERFNNAKVRHMEQVRLLVCLLPIHTRQDLRVWQRLHQEIRQFHSTGILYPVINETIPPAEHYRNGNIDPIRIIPLLLYDRILDLSPVIKRQLLPNTGGRYIIKAAAPSKNQAWKGDTAYTRRKYDKWYWDMRLRRTPFTVALRTPMKGMRSNLQRKLHFQHVDASIERNRLLRGPPEWAEEPDSC